ncbi:MAG: transcription elongation factor GreA [Clostridiales bacterium]|nr:MAG: transcription elongation factor GreA [Clostridiales bacterium]
MHDELTPVDIKKMQEEIDYRKLVLAPQLKEALRHARELGDRSENFEYHAAKRDLNKNNSRIRYLQQMIATAVVITPKAGDKDTVGLFDKICLYVEEDDEEMEIELVTTLRQDSIKGYISKESPLGKAILGKRRGDRVAVTVSDDYTYYVVIRRIEKGEDDESLAINPY